MQSIREQFLSRTGFAGEQDGGCGGRDALKHALQSFHAPNILGVTLNAVDLHQTRYAYAYDYYSNEYLGKEKRARA